MDEKDKKGLSRLLAQLIALGGGTKKIKEDIQDWPKLRTTTKIWRLLDRRGEGKPNEGWKKPD